MWSALFNMFRHIANIASFCHNNCTQYVMTNVLFDRSSTVIMLDGVVWCGWGYVGLVPHDPLTPNLWHYIHQEGMNCVYNSKYCLLPFDLFINIIICVEPILSYHIIDLICLQCILSETFRIR